MLGIVTSFLREKPLEQRWLYGDKTSRAKNLSKAACSAVNSKIGNQSNIIKIFL